MEAKQYGVRVNAITPSLISATATYQRLYQDEFSTRVFDKAASLATLGVAEPEDLANLVVFLTALAETKTSGQAISANGGISAG